jgi:UDP-N-acetylglucosamine 2-epimerase (non-hydrolysing)
MGVVQSLSPTLPLVNPSLVRVYFCEESSTLIHIVIGTKAQLVKMAPVMVELQKRGIDYNFIFTGQHHETMDALRENFDLPKPDIVLHEGKDVTSIPQMFVWVLKILLQTLTNRRLIFKSDRDGLVLVHGDTFSTLLGALMGKLARLKVGHVESGMRSFDYFHPFPEELTRVLTFYLTDIYYCPGEAAMNNLDKFRGEKLNTVYNTLIDSLNAARGRFDEVDVEIPDQPYAVVTTHRFENVFKERVLKHNLELIIKAAENLKTIFIMHPITVERLELYGLLERLKNTPNIECRPRYDYFRFMKLVYHSEFLITDGGSNQEECWFLGKPCLLLRKVTEHQEGIDSNVVLSEYSEPVVDKFVKNYKDYRSEPLLGEVSPSAMIVESALAYA